MVVERGLVRDDQVVAGLHRALEHVERCHHRDRDAGDPRVGVAGLEGIDGLSLPRHADVRLDALDDLRRGQRRSRLGRRRGSRHPVVRRAQKYDHERGECTRDSVRHGRMVHERRTRARGSPQFLSSRTNGVSTACARFAPDHPSDHQQCSSRAAAAHTVQCARIQPHLARVGVQLARGIFIRLEVHHRPRPLVLPGEVHHTFEQAAIVELQRDRDLAAALAVRSATRAVASSGCARTRAASVAAAVISSSGAPRIRPSSVASAVSVAVTSASSGAVASTACTSVPKRRPLGRGVVARELDHVHGRGSITPVGHSPACASSVIVRTASEGAAPFAIASVRSMTHAS